MNDFNVLFPNFLTQCDQLRSVLVPISFVLLVIGMVSFTVSGQRSPGAYLRTFARTAAYIVLLTQLTTWGNLMSETADQTVKNVLHADPAKVGEQYNAKLLVQSGHDNSGSWWSKISDPSAIAEQLASWALQAFGFLGSVILFYAYLAQKFILYIGYGLSPIFVGFLAVRTLQSIGVSYVLSLAGVMLWPLGWGAASVATQGLLDFMTDQSFLTGGAAGSAGYVFQNLIGIAVLGIWVIFSTIAAPVILQKAISTGAQIGSALLSDATTVGVATGTGAMGAAAAFGSGRGLGAALGGIIAGATAGATALAGSSLSGSSYSPSAAALASLGHHRQPKPEKNDDITKDQIIQELLKRIPL
ncbi:MAG: hypothetical protein JWL59_4855 [Chthoniobacteraceae bacterium]|nr:hypothetical protein [Chthoniobacteraceae bacterium]